MDVVDVEENAADAVDDITEVEDDVDVVYVEVIVACVDEGTTPVLVEDDAIWVTTGEKYSQSIQHQTMHSITFDIYTADLIMITKNQFVLVPKFLLQQFQTYGKYI